MAATSNTSINPLSAIRRGVAVTLSDATVIPITRGLWVGVSGNIKVRHPDAGDGNGATTPTYTGVPIGFFPVECDQVFLTSTTATTIIACY